MNTDCQRMGPLECHTVDALVSGASPQLQVVLCHGFGAPGTDLVPLAYELIMADRAIADQVRFIFPEAPTVVGGEGILGGRAWWPLNVEQLLAAVERGDYDQLRRMRPEGLAQARQNLLELLDALWEQTGLPLRQTVLGGFSQGAMLTTDVTLRTADRPAALCVMSGTLLCEDQWKELATQRGPLRVLQSHGRLDPILPFEAAQWLRTLFVEAGFEVEFVDFAGVHTIPRQVVDHLAALIVELLRTQR